MTILTVPRAAYSLSTGVATYELLVKCITGSFDVNEIDKDLLFGFMLELSRDCYRNLGIDYGVTSSMQEQFWKVTPGYQLDVSNPWEVPGIHEVVLSIFETNKFKPTLIADIDLEGRARNGSFDNLPYDLVSKFTTLLTDGDLFSLANASWHVHSLLRDNSSFWRQRLNLSMSWF